MTELRGSLEENVLTLLCTSDLHAPGLILILKSELFSTRYYRTIADAAIRHIEQFGKAPSNHLRDILEDQLRRGEEGLLLQKIIGSVDELAPHLQADYVLTQLHHFIKLRKLAMAIEAAAEAIQGGDIEAAQNAIYNRATHDAGTQGIWLHDADAMLAFLAQPDTDYFSSGIDIFDQRGVRPARKEVFLWLGSKKIGKSWALIQCGKQNLMHKRSVLHLTLEMSEERTAQRYIQALFAMTKDKSETIRVPIFKKDSLGRCATIDFDVLSPDTLDISIRAQVAKRLAAFKTRPRLKIKEFPTSTLTIAQLNAYLDTLDRVDNFRPDLLIIDYAKIMALDMKQPRISAGHTMEQLRGIAVQRNMAVVTAWQGNRQTDGARTVTSGMIAEDWSLAGTVDTLVTISRTPQETKVGLARVLVDAARNVEDKWTAMISQSYKTGQFAIDSVYMSKYIEEEVGRLNGEAAHEDDG